MPLDYNNPTSALPNPSDFNIGTNNPFSLYPSYQAGRNDAIAQPFIDTALKSQQYDLQKKAIETGEFAGPEQTEARRSAAELAGKKSAAEMAVLPYKTNDEINQHVEELRKRHDVTSSQMAQAQDISRQIGVGGPMSDLFHTMGNVAPEMDKATTLSERMNIHKSALAQVKAKYPNIQIPPELNDPTYRPELGEKHPFENGGKIMQEYAALRGAQMNSPDLAEKRLDIELQNQGRMQAVQAEQQGAGERTAAAVAGQQAVAETRSAAAIAAANARHPVALAVDAYNKDPSEENQHNLSAHLESEWNTEVAPKRYQFATLKEQTAPDAATRKQAEDYLKQKKIEFFAGKHVYLDPNTMEPVPVGTIHKIGNKTYKYTDPRKDPYHGNEAWTEVK